MEGVTINDIAREIGITEGTIYRHFTSKRQIFVAVIYRWREDLLSTVQTDPGNAIPALERLERAFWTQLSAVEHRALSFMMIAQAITFEGAGVGAAVASVVAEYQAAIRGMLVDGIQEGSIRPDLNLDGAATTFFGMMLGTASLRTINDYTPVSEAQGASMWEIFLRGVASTPPELETTSSDPTKKRRWRRQMVHPTGPGLGQVPIQPELPLP